MSYIYKVFEHLEQLWMCIWQHTDTATTTEFSPDLGELAEILDDVSIRFLNTLNSCGWAYGSTLTPLPPQRFPQIWESWLKS